MKYVRADCLVSPLWPEGLIQCLVGFFWLGYLFWYDSIRYRRWHAVDEGTRSPTNLHDSSEVQEPSFQSSSTDIVPLMLYLVGFDSTGRLVDLMHTDLMTEVDWLVHWAGFYVWLVRLFTSFHFISFDSMRFCSVRLIRWFDSLIWLQEVDWLVGWPVDSIGWLTSFIHCHHNIPQPVTKNPPIARIHRPPILTPSIPENQSTGYWKWVNRPRNTQSIVYRQFTNRPPNSIVSTCRGTNV